MAKPRFNKPARAIPSGSLRVWWFPHGTIRKFSVMVVTLGQARTVLRVLTEYDTFRREGMGAGGLAVFDGSAWHEWRDVDGNDIHRVMANAEVP